MWPWQIARVHFLISLPGYAYSGPTEGSRFFPLLLLPIRLQSVVPSIGGPIIADCVLVSEISAQIVMLDLQTTLTFPVFCKVPPEHLRKEMKNRDGVKWSTWDKL